MSQINSVHIDRTMYLIFIPLSSLLCILLASKALLAIELAPRAATRFAISTPLVPLPIGLIKIKAYEGEVWRRRPKKMKQASKSTLSHFCSLSRS